MFEYIVNDSSKIVRKVTISDTTLTLYTFGEISSIESNLKALLKPPFNKREYEKNGVLYEAVPSNDPKHGQAHQNIESEQYTYHSHIRRKDGKPLEQQDVQNILEIFSADKNNISYVIPPELMKEINAKYADYKQTSAENVKATSPHAKTHPHEEKIYAYIEDRAKQKEGPSLFGINIKGKFEKLKEAMSFTKEQKLQGAEWLENNQKKLIAAAGNPYKVPRFDEHQKVLEDGKLKEVFDDFCVYSKEEKIKELSQESAAPKKTG